MNKEEIKDEWETIRAGEITVASGRKCNKCGLIRPYNLEKCPCLNKNMNKDLLKCPKCGKTMKNIKDKITGKTSKYLFGCGCSPNIALSKG